MDLFDDYRVIARTGGDFQLIHKPSGTVVLTTQNVSVSTLIRLVLEDEV